MSDKTPCLFWPQTIGPYESDLNQLLATLEKGAAPFLNHVTTCLSELSYYPNSEEAHLKYEAYLRVLRDLLRQKWRPEIRQGRLYLYPPAWTEVASGDEAVRRHKEAIRKSLSWERKAQFQKQSVQEFGMVQVSLTLLLDTFRNIRVELLNYTGRSAISGFQAESLT